MIRLYRNGYPFDLGRAAFVYDHTIGSVRGFKIDPVLVNPDDFFTCDYTPIGDPTVVSFEALGFDIPPLVFSYDETGSGERRLSTGERNTVQLDNEPYIDPYQSEQSGYHPIIVRLEDGTVPQNLTDYQTRKSVPLPSDGYYYIHSGNTLMFNRPIRMPFRVYYQYLQNNVRFRVILRCNNKDFVSPKVDYVHVKAKTRQSDARKV